MSKVPDLKDFIEDLTDEEAVEMFKNIIENSLKQINTAKTIAEALLRMDFITVIDSYVFFLTLSETSKVIAKDMEKHLKNSFEKVGVKVGEEILEKIRNAIIVVKKEEDK